MERSSLPVVAVGAVMVAALFVHLWMFEGRHLVDQPVRAAHGVSITQGEGTGPLSGCPTEMATCRVPLPVGLLLLGLVLVVVRSAGSVVAPARNTAHGWLPARLERGPPGSGPRVVVLRE